MLLSGGRSMSAALLSLVKLLKPGIPSQQLLWRTKLNQFTILHHRNHVTVQDGFDAMRDGNNCAIHELFMDDLMNDLFCCQVDAVHYLCQHIT